MGSLVYSAIASADGYVVDAEGSFAWAMPTDEVHAFVNDLERGTGTYLYGRRMYEVMRFWEDVPGLETEPEVMRDFQKIWAAADKVVFSRSLEAVTTGRTRLVRELDPAVVATIVQDATAPVSIGGPTLAAAALRAGLVDEVRVLRVPVAVGGGTPVFPPGLRLDLTLVDSRTFSGGTTYAAYRPADAA